jgi:hypothetical protein
MYVCGGYIELIKMNAFLTGPCFKCSQNELFSDTDCAVLATKYIEVQPRLLIEPSNVKKIKYS